MAIVAGIVQILVALILIFFNFGPTDLVVLLAGALGVAGGLTANKGLMIGSMLCCIFAGIIYGIVSAGWLFMGEEINHPSNTSPWFYEEDCYGPNGDLNMEENCKLELMFLTSFMFIALVRWVLSSLFPPCTPRLPRAPPLPAHTRTFPFPAHFCAKRCLSACVALH